MTPTTPLRIALFLAILLTGLAMGAALAHLLEMPRKLGLSRDDYLVTQQIYAGWAWLGVLLLLELVAMVATAWLGRGDGLVLWLALAAIAALAVAQAIFWTWTFPANAATQQWTMLPDNWEALRTQWEYSHAAGAVFQVIAFAALVWAAAARVVPVGTGN
jgi:hypothetical protein